MKAGSITHRCACRDPETGKQYGKSCPKANKKGHGTLPVRQELPPTADGERRVFRRSGYPTVEKAQADLDKVRALLAIPDKDDDEGRDAIAALLVQVAADSKQPIPDPRRPPAACGPARASSAA